METPFIVGLNNVLCSGYVLMIAWVNCTMYLISSFYRKKFNQPAPRYGFITAIIFAILYVASLFFTGAASTAQANIFEGIRTTCIIGSAVASGWSSVNLLIVMKRARK